MNGIRRIRMHSGFSNRGFMRASASNTRQQGMTTLGFLILAMLLSLIAFGALRLTPIYLNYMKVLGVVNGVHSEFDGQKPTRTQIVSSISRRFDVESVSALKAKDVKVTPVDGGMQVSAVYDHTSPFIGNISFVVHFDKTELIRR